MLSRVAESLYWMSRYVERAENVARLLDVGFYLELDAAGLAADDDGHGPVEGALTILACRESYEAAHGAISRDSVLRYLTFDRKNSQSIRSMIAMARENARATQEVLSAEAWSQLNRLYLYLTGAKAQRRFGLSPFRFYDSITRACLLWDGLVDSTLPRNEVFHFLQLGRYLERLDQISRIVAARCHTLCETEPGAVPSLRMVHWTSLLRSCSAYDAYLRTYRDRIDPESLVRFLLLDADFPRALQFCVARCRESLHEVSGGGAGYGSEAERLLGRLEGELRYIDVDEIFARGLPSVLTAVQEASTRVGEEIHRAYFAT
ncbi:MAG TPA: alpha-E domain-containing protein [Isosphaeraceae bacterium]|jgi:uncharacterized alpha-E superfamily protein|nr:alpha-E domain-containing protein [Isosphaeraceae bacterium]